VRSPSVVCVSEGVSSLYRSVGVTPSARFTEPGSTPLHHPPGIDGCRHEQVGPRRWPGGRGRALGVHAPGPAPLGPVFTLLLPCWAWITVPSWAWPGFALD
jgi:hypothetical protein